MHTSDIRTDDTDFKRDIPEKEIDASIARARREAEREEADWELACLSDPYPGTPDDDEEDDQQQTVLGPPQASEEELAADEWLLERAECSAAVARIRARRETRRRNEDAARAAREREQKTQTAADARIRGTAPRARARRSPSSRRGTVRRGAGGGGDSSDDDGDPEPRRQFDHDIYDIFDYSRLAVRWNCSPRSIANQFCRRPDSLPPHITLPAVRGPRWLRRDIEEFERQRRQIPDRPKPKRGRPRIAGGRQ